MKILQVIESMSKSSGGPASCTYHLVKALNYDNVQCDIVTTYTADNYSDEFFIKYLPDDKITPLRYSSALNTFLKENVTMYDIIHANGLWMYSSHNARIAAQRNHKPFVLSPHGMLYPEALKVSSWKKKLIFPLFQRLDLEKADVLHATCKAEMVHLRNFGLKQPIAVIPNALSIDLSTLSDLNRKNSSENYVFGFVGRINPIKNIDRLLEAWRLISDYCEDASLWIIGSGEEEYTKSLKEYVKNNNLRNVTFTGFIFGQELVDKVKQLDFLVLPSKSENFGMVVPEALIHGVPVIASKGTPWEELPKEDCGWWIDNDSQSIANTILDAINLSKESRFEMGQNGRHFVLDNFVDTIVAKKMLDLYEWILGKSQKPDFVYE